MTEIEGTVYDPTQQHGNPAGPSRSKRRQLIALAVFLVLALAFFGFAWLRTRHNPEAAGVGDCVRRTGPDAVQVVNCGDAKAEFKVVGRVADKTQVEAELSACEPYADLGAERVFWAGEQGKKGYVLCLAKKGVVPPPG